MTRKEAIEVLKNAAFLATTTSYQSIEEAVKIAVTALEQPEPCEDAVSRQAVIDVLGVFTQADALGHTPKQIVEALPSAQSEIIRCKDCKYMTEHYDTDGNVPYWTCSEWDSGTDYDGFCHYAERRADDCI